MALKYIPQATFYLRLLLNVTTVTTEHQKLPKMSQSCIKRFFFAPRAKKALAEGRSPPQEVEVGPCSGPYLLVSLNISIDGSQPTCMYRLMVSRGSHNFSLGLALVEHLVNLDN